MKAHIVLSRLFMAATLAMLAGFAAFAGKPKVTKFEIFNGTNIAHWLSQSGARGAKRAAFFTEKDVAQIAEWGFDHIRIPIDEEQMFNDDGTKNREAFDLLKNALDWCSKYKLRAIVDMHILRSHNFGASKNKLFTDPAAAERFCEVWTLISSELKGYSVKNVAYELMNEPVADKPGDWNRVAMQCYRVVRKLEPRRVIVIGSNRWQSYETVKDLELPHNDPNVIISYHYYNPFALTHYSASWTDQRFYKGDVHYPGFVMTKEDIAKLSPDLAKKFGFWAKLNYDKERLRSDFMQVVNVARAKGLRVYCGEYGCLCRAPKADRLRWYADMCALFREMGIAHSNWCYKEDGFGIVSSTNGKVDYDILGLMLGKDMKPRQ